MKVKTFILTFLMMMSSPFLFGQHWTDPGNSAGYQNSMTVFAQIVLDNNVQEGNYEVAAFYGNELLRVTNIIPFQGTTSNYHVHLSIPGNSTMDNIYFKFYDGTNEYVSETSHSFVDNEIIGDHPNYSTINFKSVAQIEGTEYDVVYSSLQAAIDAVANGQTITLLDNNAENVTVVQAPDKAFTIDGADKTYTGVITVDGKSAAYATAGLTIKNVNFDATEVADACISLGVSGNNNTRYTSNVTVEDCTFTGVGQAKAGIKNYTGGCKNLTVKGCEADGLHSLVQVKGVTGVTVNGVTVENCKNGISVGTSTNVVVKNSEIATTGYGVRADGSGAYEMTMSDNTISAELPVVVRNATGAYNLTVESGNNFTAGNTDGYQVVFTNGDDGTYEAPTGIFNLTVDENTDLNVYPVYVAKIGQKGYMTIDAAITAAQAGDVVTILAGQYTQQLNINKDITVVGERGENGEYLVKIWKAGLSITADGATAKDIYVYNPEGNGVYVNAKDVLIEGCDIAGNNGTRYCYTTGTVTFKDSYIGGGTYGIHFDGNANGNIVIDNCEIVGWTSFAGTITNVAITGTTFSEGNYNQLRFYQNAQLTNCTFPAEMTIDFGKDDVDADFTTCSVKGGAPLTDIIYLGDIVEMGVDVTIDGEPVIVEAKVADADGKNASYYLALEDALTAAKSGQTITLLTDVEENVTVNKSVTIDGAEKTYTGKMDLGEATVALQNINFVKGNVVAEKTTLTVKDCDFDGKGMDTYAMNLGHTQAVVLERVTGKNYSYGLVQVKSSNVSFTAKNITVSDCSIAIKVDYSNAVTLENVNLSGSSAGFLNSNYGEKTITIKNSKLNILGTWTRKNTIKTTYVFEGENSIDEFVIDAAIDNFKLADANSTLTAPNEITVTTSVENSLVKYVDGAYIVIPAVAKIGDVCYETMADAIAAIGEDDVVIELLDDATFDYNARDAYGTANTTSVTINGNGKTLTLNQKDSDWASFGLANAEAKVVFNNMIIEKTGYGDTSGAWNTHAIIFSSIVEMTDVTVNNSMAVQAGATLNNVTINEANGYYGLWINGNGQSVTMGGSEINATNGGRGIKVADQYIDNPASVTLNVTGTTFNTAKKAAVLVSSTAGANITASNVDITNVAEDNENFAWVDEDWAAHYGNVTVTGGTLTQEDLPVFVAALMNGEKVEGYYKTLVDAVAAGQTVNVLKDATGAGLSIDKDVTIDFGGYTYTINQAVGSAGTESQGFQLLKDNTVTLKNGNIAIAEGTNVKWMFNAYADVTLDGLNVNCANMATAAEGEANYVLVVNNGGSATPTVNYSNVTIEEFEGTPIWLDPTTTLKGEGLESLIETEEGYVVVYENGEYTAIAGNVLNETTGAKYATLADAISAATAGNTIKLLADRTEDVTVNKDLTIDGANFNYTGNIAVKGSAVDVVVKNVNFVNGTGYAITTNTIKSVTVENCTVTNYGYGFLYANKSTPTVVVKNVTVDGANYGFHWVYGTTATLENVTMTDVTNGLYIQNYASKTINVKGGNISSIAIWERSGSSGVQTFKFEGANTVGTLSTSQYAKYVLAEADATLTAPEGATVTTTVEGSIVKYEDGKYVVKGAVAAIGEEIYATIQEAIDAAENGQTIVVLQDITLGIEDATEYFDETYKYETFFNVADKTVTLDLNGKTVKAVLEGEETVMALMSVEADGQLTLKDSDANGNGTLEINAETNIYSLLMCYTGGKMNIESGNYKLNLGRNGSGLVYSQENRTVTVNGGNFWLGNVGTLDNDSPWIFNGKGKNENTIIVNGGTFNADILHQYWVFEVNSPVNNAIVNNGNGTWSVITEGAVAYVTEKYNFEHNIYATSYINSVGYTTLEDAFAAAHTYNYVTEDGMSTVTMLKDVELESTIRIAAGEEVILDLNGKVVSGTCNSGQAHMIMVQNTADLTIKDSSEDADGKLTFAKGTSDTGWVIDLEGDLTLESGTIELTGESWSIGYAVDVRPNSWGTEYTEATTFTMNGGKLVSSDGAVRVASSSADTHENVSANFVMNGGEIEAAWDGIFVQQSNAAYDILNVEINDGKITSPYSIFRLYGPAATSVLNNVERPITLNITGGTFDYTDDDLANEKWLVSGVIMVSGGATFEEMLGYTNFEITGGTFDGDVNAYCAEGFGTIANEDGTWTVMPVQKQNLVKGWNWYSSYLNIETEDLLGALGTNGKSIVLNNTWDASYEDGMWWHADHTFDVSKMYMIETSAACELDLAGELVDASTITITLEKGWNWIGYPSNVATSLSTALQNLNATHSDMIKDNKGGMASYYDYEGTKMWLVATLQNMEPTQGYMYFNASDETKTFKYNIVPNRSNNERLADNHYVADATKYPYNMTVVAVVDDAIGSNYEVAAFVNGEVRGSARPIYVEPMDAYMLFLSISGNDVEEVSFKYYDIDTNTEYDLVNRFNYSNNAMVGSVNEPYVFSRGATGIGEASLSEFNIYPNPTTIGTEINLEATCDTVEVFNALGVKIEEYQNVDSIDAFETAGIYVIRITNNGDVKHCRVIVK